MQVPVKHVNLPYNLTIMKIVYSIFLAVVNVCGATAFAAQGDWADDNQFSLSAGFDYSSGKYGTINSAEMLSIPSAGENETGQWMFKVAVPYARISGEGGAANAGGHIGAIGAAKDTRSAINDTVAAASYNIYSGSASKFGIDITGKVKLNTVGMRAGNGKNDYAAQADAYQSFNKFTAIGSFGYKVLGRSDNINMNKVFYGSFGGSYRLDDNMHGGVDLNLSQGSSISGAGHRELSAYVSRKINKNFKAKGYVLKGLSNGSPDSSLGAQVHYGF